MTANQVMKAGKLSVSGQTISAKLISLSMQDFDVILGMDWLAANQATIDCAKKEMPFKPLSGPSFKFEGTKQGSLKVVSALKAKRLLQHGAWAYLANMMDVNKELPSLE